ncbi:hypothetical protein JCM19235_5130 [Vibrio maritimus]|uniref:Uncharacterized protein n=1 Tax=Vibrio maritimus TaxID=990268 RepID=A0A090RMX3_9VIBR|nr:hypothetical protein JCM19235_5130 [Vibrio maritimus]
MTDKQFQDRINTLFFCCKERGEQVSIRDLSNIIADYIGEQDNWEELLAIFKSHWACPSV